MSKHLDPDQERQNVGQDQDRQNVGPDLGLNGLQRLTADDHQQQEIYTAVIMI